MNNEADVLWNLYEEHCTWERHHETQRTSVTSLLVAVTAGVLSVIAFDHSLSRSDMPLTFFLTVIGIFGAVFSAKHYERFSMHQERANQYRALMDGMFPALLILQTRAKADNLVATRFPCLHNLRLHYFWVGLHVLIALLGMALTICALLGGST